MKRHLTQMLTAGGALLAVLLAVGVELGDALRWAALLACPLMMVGMMAIMGRGHSGSDGHRHGPGSAESTTSSDDEVVDAPPARP
jgi:hypothetical protein